MAWSEAVKAADHPSSLIFSRQNLKFQARDEQQLNDIKRGAYVISEAQGNAQAVVIATGSEVELALEAQKVLAEQGIAVRVVSMPSTNVFDRQDAAYKAAVLPEGLPRVAVEAGHADGWYKYVSMMARLRSRNQQFGRHAADTRTSCSEYIVFNQHEAEKQPAPPKNRVMLPTQKGSTGA